MFIHGWRKIGPRPRHVKANSEIQEDFKKIENNPDITPIGHITDADYGWKLISKSGNEHELLAQGWKVFNKE